MPEKKNPNHTDIYNPNNITNMEEKKKKVVVAFSGGLDTSYNGMYLAKEKGVEAPAPIPAVSVQSNSRPTRKTPTSSVPRNT